MGVASLEWQYDYFIVAIIIQSLCPFLFRLGIVDKANLARVQTVNSFSTADMPTYPYIIATIRWANYDLNEIIHKIYM